MVSYFPWCLLHSNQGRFLLGKCVTGSLCPNSKRSWNFPTQFIRLLKINTVFEMLTNYISQSIGITKYSLLELRKTEFAHRVCAENRLGL